MATRTTHANDRNATDLAVGHDAQFIGTDGEGYDHYWSTYERTMTVLDGGDVDRVEHVGDRSLTEWADFVAETRGEWAELRVSDQPLADALEVSDA